MYVYNVYTVTMDLRITTIKMIHSSICNKIACVSVYACTNAHTYAHTQKYTHSYTHKHTYTHTSTHKYKQTHIKIHKHTHIHTNSHTCSYTHTHIHTHMCSMAHSRCWADYYIRPIILKICIKKRAINEYDPKLCDHSHLAYMLKTMCRPTDQLR